MHHNEGGKTIKFKNLKFKLMMKLYKTTLNFCGTENPNKQNRVGKTPAESHECKFN